MQSNVSSKRHGSIKNDGKIFFRVSFSVFLLARTEISSYAPGLFRCKTKNVDLCVSKLFGNCGDVRKS